MHIIKLQSADGEIFQVDRDIAKVSVTINTLIDDLGIEEGVNEIIPLPTTKGSILKRVITWATHHKDDPPPEKYAGRRTEDITEWDKDFMKMEKGTIFEIILAAQYLNIKGLLDLACKTIANMINGKTPEEIRGTFNIINDHTPAEEEMIRKENDLCRKL